jgi:hypothetical protein
LITGNLIYILVISIAPFSLYLIQCNLALEEKGREKRSPVSIMGHGTMFRKVGGLSFTDVQSEGVVLAVKWNERAMNEKAQQHVRILHRIENVDNVGGIKEHLSIYDIVGGANTFKFRI